MKVTIHSLGGIDKAEIDLKPLTIFVGPNNSGKTWLAYTIASIVGPWGLGSYSKAYTDEVVAPFPSIDEAVEQIVNEGNIKFDLIKFADEYGEQYFNNVAKLAPQWMQEFLGTERVTFKGLDVSISLIDVQTALSKRVLASSLERKLSARKAKTALLTALKEEDKQELYMYTTTEEDVLEKLPLRAIKRFVLNTVFGTLHSTLYTQTYIFPAERTTFITFPFYKKSEEDTIVTSETPQRERRGKPVSIAISHFLELMQVLYGSSLTGRIENFEKYMV